MAFTIPFGNNSGCLSCFLRSLADCHVFGGTPSSLLETMMLIMLWWKVVNASKRVVDDDGDVMEEVLDDQWWRRMHDGWNSGSGWMGWEFSAAPNRLPFPIVASENGRWAIIASLYVLLLLFASIVDKGYRLSTLNFSKNGCPASKIFLNGAEHSLCFIDCENWGWPLSVESLNCQWNGGWALISTVNGLWAPIIANVNGGLVARNATQSWWWACPMMLIACKYLGGALHCHFLALVYYAAGCLPFPGALFCLLFEMAMVVGHCHPLVTLHSWTALL